MWSWLETSNNKITETQLDEKDDPVTKILNDMVKRDELDNIKEESDEQKESNEPKEQKEQNEPKESNELNEPTEPESEGESDGTKEAEWEKELDRKSCMNCQKTTYIQFTMKRSHLIIFVLSYSINLFLTIYNYTKKH